MRDLYKVIGQMLKVVPASEKGFRQALEYHRNTLEFAAPEAISYHWGLVGKTLNELIVIPSTEWQYKVAAIWLDRPLEEIKQRFNGMYP